MKKELSLLLAIFFAANGMSQQTFSLAVEQKQAAQPAAGVRPAVPEIKNKTLKLYGIGSLNTETLNKINSSGKIALSIIPYYNAAKHRFWEVYLSFNKNATNNDSILASTVIFPEVGTHSFLATIKRIYAIKGNAESHYFAPFFEFSQKNIKVDTNSSQGKNTSGFFSALTYTFGYPYVFNKIISNTEVGFSFVPYISIVNIPDEDNEDYRKLFKSPDLPSSLWSFGFKTIFQIKGFQIFADMRHLWGSDKKVPRDLRGFNSNIGVTFNADIFEL